MKRRTSSIAALGLLLVLVAAFVPAAGLAGSAGSSQTTTVSLAGWASSPEETAALNRTIAQFERLNRNIDVDYTPISGDYDAAMLARFAAKRPPDVFYVDSLDLFDYQPALEPLN
ncbi:MAG: extracellular solute-binding protein family 1, partial [Gaiellaceae bacterium]|nr:extracellular solute-binding protein family 1 [Gaiellaceae bacterium]